MASRSESAMKQRSNSSRLLAERRVASALPTPNVSTDRELMLRRSDLASASGSASRSLNISCNSETFHNWLSRASSAVSVRSDGSCLSSINAKNEAARCVSSSGHRRCQSSCGRPTRARCACVCICETVCGCGCRCVCVCVCVHDMAVWFPGGVVVSTVCFHSTCW